MLLIPMLKLLMLFENNRITLDRYKNILKRLDKIK